MIFSRSVLLNQGSFALRAHVSILQTLFFITFGRGASGMWEAETTKVVKLPTKNRTGFHNKGGSGRK
jgi:hypothetical protein